MLHFSLLSHLSFHSEEFADDLNDEQRSNQIKEEKPMDSISNKPFKPDSDTNWSGPLHFHTAQGIYNSGIYQNVCGGVLPFIDGFFIILHLFSTPLGSAFRRRYGESRHFRLDDTTMILGEDDISSGVCGRWNGHVSRGNAVRGKKGFGGPEIGYGIYD